MRVQFNLGDEFHLMDKSRYNHNYYLLPYTIEQCTVLLEECQDDLDAAEYTIGNFNNRDVFIGEYSWYGDEEGNVDLIKNRI